MTWDDAVARLTSAGLAAWRRSYGVEGFVEDRAGRHVFQLGGSSGGGVELGIRRDPREATDARMRWFQEETVEAIVELIVAAQRCVTVGTSHSVVDALDSAERRLAVVCRTEHQ